MNELRQIVFGRVRAPPLGRSSMFGLGWLQDRMRMARDGLPRIRPLRQLPQKRCSGDAGVCVSQKLYLLCTIE